MKASWSCLRCQPSPGCTRWTFAFGMAASRCAQLPRQHNKPRASAHAQFVTPQLRPCPARPQPFGRCCPLASPLRQVGDQWFRELACTAASGGAPDEPPCSLVELSLALDQEPLRAKLAAALPPAAGPARSLLLGRPLFSRPVEAGWAQGCGQLLASVEQLDLEGCFVDGSIDTLAPLLAAAPRLTKLRLGMGAMHALPPSVAALTGLTSLCLEFNELAGASRRALPGAPEVRLRSACPWPPAHCVRCGELPPWIGWRVH